MDHNSEDESLNENNEHKQSSNKLLGKKVKRSQLKNFKNNPHYITEKADKSKSLWGDEKPISLEELTLNIVPDDDNNNKKKKLVWDPKKKNFIKANTDKQGKIIKTNESGARINKNDKNPQLFSKWKKKNMIKSLPRTGELENDRLIEKVSNNFKERKFAKKTNPKVKNELKTFNQLLKSKKDQFKKTSRKKFSKKDAKERMIKERSHLNRKSQTLIRKRKK